MTIPDQDEISAFSSAVKDMSDGVSGAAGLRQFMDLRIPVQIILGRKRIPFHALRKLTKGEILEFDQQVGSPLDLVVNGARVAQGEVVILNDRYGFRITQIFSARERQASVIL